MPYHGPVCQTCGHKKHSFEVDSLPPDLYFWLKDFTKEFKISKWRIVVEALRAYQKSRVGNIPAPLPVQTVQGPATPTPPLQTWPTTQGTRAQVAPRLAALLRPGDILDEDYGEFVLVKRGGATISLRPEASGGAQEPDSDSPNHVGTHSPDSLGG